MYDEGKMNNWPKLPILGQNGWANFTISKRGDRPGDLQILAINKLSFGTDYEVLVKLDGLQEVGPSFVFFF